MCVCGGGGGSHSNWHKQIPQYSLLCWLQPYEFLIYTHLILTFYVNTIWHPIANLLLCWDRGVNLYGLRISLTDFCHLHGLTGVRCNPYGYLWFLQIQTYNHSMLYIRTVVTKVNDLSHNKLCFVCLLYMGVLQQDPIPKMCFYNGVDNL